MRRIGCLIVLVLLTASCSSGPSTPTAKPTPPFKLTADEERNVDRLLARWEQWNAGVKTFDCRFKRWVYDTVSGRPDTATFVDLGVLKYAAPGKWLFHVETTEKNDRAMVIEDARAEHWVFDGESLVEYNHVKKQVVEHKLPADIQGGRFLDGPLTFPSFAIYSSLFGSGGPPSPFPFRAKAKDLKEQYYIREVTPAKERDQIWLDAYPRTAAIAANCQRLQLIFRAADMSPVAMKIVQPNGKDYVVYQFYEIAVNASPPPPGDDAFHPPVPFGWQKIAEEPLAPGQRGQGLIPHPPKP